MTVPVWEPGKFYNPGATVRPVTTAPVISTPIANPGFELGAVDWTTETNWSIVSDQGDHDHPFEGTKYAMFSGTGPSESRIVSQTIVPVRVGQAITARCQVRRKRSAHNGGRVEIDWLDSSHVLIFSSQGNTIETTGSTTGNWRESKVEAFAPAGAAFMRVAGFAYRSSGSHKLFLDAFSWDYSYAPDSAGLVFTAVQPDAGFSAGTEPIWPDTEGLQVVDNEVIWEAVDGSRVVWEANPILVSEYLEPDWPLDVGANVADGTIIWTAISRRVEDSKCPHSPIVVIATSKVFAGDDDIIPFSATVNPLDWSTPEDAGYLPFGLQDFGANPVAALGLYRGNLAAFNSEGYQMWQIGEDPDDHALLDGGPVSCVWPRTVLPVSNDLMFLSAVGVRNVGIANASTNLQVGDVGEPIDVLVLEKLAVDNPYSSADDPFSLYVPSLGQYWLFFGDEAFVMTINGKKNRSWSRYTFPEAVTDWTLDGNDLILRTENHRIWRFTNDALEDDQEISPEEGGDNAPIFGVMQWPHLDLGTPGVEKQFVGFDLTADAPEGVGVAVCYDQRDPTIRTTNYDMDADSLPGKLVPIPVGAPSFALRLAFEPSQKWEWQMSIMYIQDMGIGS